MNSEPRFWLVFRGAFVFEASHKHTSRDLAKAEALRLANKYLGSKFYVAAVIGVAEFPVADVGWTELQKE